MNKDLQKILSCLEEDSSFSSAEDFMRCAVEFLAESAQGEKPVSPPDDPETLWQLIQAPLPENGRPLDEVLQEFQKKILPYSIRLHHPRYMGHQVSSSLPPAIWMEPVIGVMNQSVAVREMSPMGTMVELLVLRWLSSLVGMGEEAGGLITSGGTEATYTALLTARNEACPSAWEKGMADPLPVILCGEHSHYSVERAAGQLGIGRENCIRIPSFQYHLDPGSLEQTLSRLQSSHRKVMAVVATAGTTSTGSFDDLKTIGKVCRQSRVWFHVDGAHGASAIFSPHRRHFLEGIEYADSLSWDPHKMMLMPLSAGMVLFRQGKKQQRAFSQSAPYLFHTKEEKQTWDQGTRSFQCSRRFDALKIWFAIQRYGTNGFGLLYDHLCGMADLFYRIIQDRNDFQACHRPESNIFCFRFIGKRSQDTDYLNTVNARLRQDFNAKGFGWLTMTRLGDQTVLRIVVMNPRTQPSDIDQVIRMLSVQGHALQDGPIRPEKAV